MSQKFQGTIEELKTIVSSTGISGDWEVDRSGKHTFRSYDGGVLNCWQSSGTVQYQGKPEGKAILEQLVGKLLDKGKCTTKPTRAAAENGLEPRPGIGPVSRSQLTPLAAGRYCLDDRSLKRIKEALSASGNTIMLVNDSLHVVPQSGIFN